MTGGLTGGETVTYTTGVPSYVTGGETVTYSTGPTYTTGGSYVTGGPVYTTGFGGSGVRQVPY